MRLYVANVTHQKQLVYYRLDFIHEGNAAQRTSSLKQLTIEPGQQTTVGGDLTLAQVQIIMDQLTPYGGVGVEELNRLPQQRIAYVMSIDKPVQVRHIRVVNEHNNELLANAGNVRRRNAAIAAHPILDQQIDGLKKLDIEMLEMPPEKGDPDPIGKPLDFGAHVDRNAREAAQPKARRGKKSARQ